MNLPNLTPRRVYSQTLLRRLILLGAGTFLVYAAGHFLYNYFVLSDRLVRVIHYL